jgi:3-hydroxyisobutyrate dehydrogenase-like beta-hydroxyacid dehydrogenase
MALNLRKHGIPVVVHNRSHQAEKVLLEAGASVASSPAAVAAACPVVVTMLPDAPDVEAVLDGPQGVWSALQPGTVIVDSSTIAPAAATRLAAETAARGGSYLDAPVSGGEIGAIEGTLTFMIGGDAAALAKVRPLLAHMGKEDRIVHVGPSGAGQICKACNQLVIGGTMLAVAEAMALARKAGVDGAKVRQALLGGFAASRVLEVHGERMLTGNYKPGFKARLYKKDLRVVQETMAAHGVPALATALVQQLVHAQLAAGGGEDDYSGIATVVFDLAGLS